MGANTTAPLLFLLFSFCSQYESKKDIAGHDILDSMHENALMHEIWVMVSPLYISEFVHNYRSHADDYLSDEGFRSTNGYLSNKRSAQSRRGDHWSPAQTHRSSVGMKVDINPRSGRPMVAPTKAVRDSYSNERSSLKRTISLNPVGATIGRPLKRIAQASG